MVALKEVKVRRAHCKVGVQHHPVLICMFLLARCCVSVQ